MKKTIKYTLGCSEMSPKGSCRYAGEPSIRAVPLMSTGGSKAEINMFTG